MKTFIRQILSWMFNRGTFPFLYVLLIDSLIVVFGGYLGRYLEVGGSVFTASFWPFTYGLIICLILYLCSFRFHHTYRAVVRYSSYVDLRRCVYATFSGFILTCLFGWAINHALADKQLILMPDMVIAFIMFLFTTLFMWLERVAIRTLFEKFNTGKNVKKTFIYGVKEGGLALARAIQNQSPKRFALMGFISPDGNFASKYLMDVRVYPENGDLMYYIRKNGVENVIISPLQVNHIRENEELVSLLIDNGINLMMISDFEEWDGKTPVNQSQLKDVEIEDLLPREKIDVDLNTISELLAGKRVLITGAAGSIGSEIVKQVALFKPEEMILIDQAETPMHDLRLLMNRKYKDVNCHIIVASITDKEYMEYIFSHHKPDYVFHTAAYKHVPMMEYNPVEAVRNNINGTRIIADLAVKYGTKKFVMVSTDKAVNPTNVMGCSKRICEIYCQSLNKAILEGKVDGVTQFVTTRFGNVLGSNGSVIPIFREQIKNGGPVTVTHADIIRFFMLIPEACKLVLEAGTMGKGGEIFVFDMGKPVKIVDLAKRMIALSGAQNIDIEFTGLREGEKLYEEVLSEQENTIPTRHPKIMVAKVREYDYDTARMNEDRLLEATHTYDIMKIVSVMKEIVPEFKSKESLYVELDK